MKNKTYIKWQKNNKKSGYWVTAAGDGEDLLIGLHAIFSELSIVFAEKLDMTTDDAKAMLTEFLKTMEASNDKKTNHKKYDRL